MMASLWPADADPKPLLSLRIKCSVDELFKKCWASPEFSAQLHQVRGDSNLLESSWVDSRDQLPQPQYTWTPGPAPAAGAGGVTAGRWRKVRFESPPSAMASKPFSNEEIQRCAEHAPGRRYVLEVQANTTAPYGDKFDVCLRVGLFSGAALPGGSAAEALLYVECHVQWSPSMNRMMKGMISKAIEGGVRGAYRQQRQLLEKAFPCEDVPEGTLAVLLTAGPTTEGVVAPATPDLVAAPPPPLPLVSPVAVHSHAHAGPAAGPAHGSPDGGLLHYAYGQLVWGEQVVALSRLATEAVRSAAAQGSAAHIAAVAITLIALHCVVTVLVGVRAVCTRPRHVVWFACLPVTYLLDLPTSLSQVLVSLALVAGVNYAMIAGARLAMNALEGPTTGGVPLGLPPAATPRMSLGAQVVDAVAGSIVSQGAGVVAPAGTAADVSAAATAATAAAVAAAAAVDVKSSASASPLPVLLRNGRPIHISKAAPKRPDIVPPKGRTQPPIAPPHRSGSSGSLGQPTTPVAVTTAAVAAAPLAGAAAEATCPAAVPAAAWPAAATAAVVAPASATHTSTSPVPAPKPAEAPPAMEMTNISSGGATHKATTAAAAPAVAAGNSTGETAAAALPTSAAPPATSPAPITSGAAAAPVPVKPVVKQPPSAVGASIAAMVSAREGSPGTSPPVHAVSSSLLAAPQAESVAAGKPIAPPPGLAPLKQLAPQQRAADVASPAAQAAVRGSSPEPASRTSFDQGNGGATVKAKPAAKPEASSSSLPAQPNSPRRVIPHGVGGGLPHPPSGSGSVAAGMVFGAQYPPGAIPQLHGSSWMKSMSESLDALSEGFKGAFGIKPAATMPSDGVLPDMRTLVGSASDAASMTALHGPGGRPLPYTMLVMGPDLVEEEVFENERFQPFRGWGHTWPGHFLPSDRVGHWSDVAGGPGGSASMTFEHVEPPLPPGYAWVEDEWQLDMEGQERDAVDDAGWTYALDFNFLKHPPPAGGGKCGLKHFVRRRRWFRTRTRLPSMPLASPTPSSAPSATLDSARGLPGAVDGAAGLERQQTSPVVSTGQGMTLMPPGGFTSEPMPARPALQRNSAGETRRSAGGAGGAESGGTRTTSGASTAGGGGSAASAPPALQAALAAAGASSPELASPVVARRASSSAVPDGPSGGPRQSSGGGGPRTELSLGPSPTQDNALVPLEMAPPPPSARTPSIPGSPNPPDAHSLLPSPRPSPAPLPTTAAENAASEMDDAMAVADELAAVVAEAVKKAGSGWGAAAPSDSHGSDDESGGFVMGRVAHPLGPPAEPASPPPGTVVLEPSASDAADAALASGSSATLGLGGPPGLTRTSTSTTAASGAAPQDLGAVPSLTWGVAADPEAVTPSASGSFPAPRLRDDSASDAVLPARLLAKAREGDEGGGTRSGGGGGAGGATTGSALQAGPGKALDEQLREFSTASPPTSPERKAGGH